MSGLSKEDSDELGFVFSCLFHQAITLDEMKEWCYGIIENRDDYPDYILSLTDFTDAIAKLSRVIGFTPHWPFLEEDKIALYGMAYQRGVDVFDCPISKEQAINELKRRPYIETKFKEIFPENRVRSQFPLICPPYVVSL